MDLITMAMTNQYTDQQIDNIASDALDSAIASAVSSFESQAEAKIQEIIDDTELSDDIASLKEDITNVQDTIEDVLVEQSSGGIGHVTLTNIENSSDFYQSAPVGSANGLAKVSISDGIASYKGGTGQQVSPYVSHDIASGTKKWICGFKYKFEKTDQNLGDPENVRVFLGASQSYDSPVSWGQWVSFAQTVTLDLTRIRLAARNFASAPTGDQFTLQIKDMYLYDATDVSDELCTFIMQQQSSNYQDGTVTYGEDPTYVYAPDKTLAIEGKAADSKAVGDALGNKLDTSDFNQILVYQSVGESVTVTNGENTAAYVASISGNGFAPTPISDGVLKVTAKESTEVSPYISHSGAWGTKKWIVGFKWKLTKVDQSLSNPENVRIHLGATAYDHSVVWGEWVNFGEVATLDLTRIRFATRYFATAPAAGSFYAEIKDMYLYDATDISNEMCTTIIASQNASYQDGTVTYGESTVGYFPDVSLNKTGKAADSKAVGDTIAEAQINVKNYGVKGDGTTDDTDAINALFASKTGNFYFPTGTYKISGTINLPEKSTMYGDGDATVIDMYSCDNLTQCVFRGGNRVYPYILVDHAHTKLHDFKLIGNNTLKEQRHFAVGVLDTQDCYISNLTIYNINYDAEQTDDNVVVSGYGIGVLRSYRVYVDHCYVEQCGYECIGIVDYSHHCVVKNCITKNGWRTCIQVHRGAYDVDIISNQMIQNAQAWDACFTLHGLTDDDLVRNLRIENNTFDASVSPRTRIYDYAAVIQLMSYCDGLWVENNRVVDGDRGLYAAASVEHLTVIGNLFQCNDESDYGLKIESVNPIIVGNVVENEAGASNIISASAVKAANIGIS